MTESKVLAMTWFLLKSWLLKQRVLILSLILLIGTLLPLLLSGYVRWHTRNQRYTEVSQVPKQPVTIVFGAGLEADGTPSPILADRIQAGVALYQAGRTRKLLMTGDNSTKTYDEVTAMKQYAVSLGVPAQNITLDYAGFNTYDSCYRAKAIFGVSQAILVSQKYHLPRALYTCQQLGIKTVGLGTADWESYGKKVILPYAIREVMATLKALWHVHFMRPQPTFLGPFEGIQ